jgi:hypothetical protein
LRGRGHRPVLAAILTLTVLGGGAGIYCGGGAPTVEAPPPTPTTGPNWEKLQVPEPEDRYSLTAAQADAGGVAPDTSFVLAAQEGARLSDLERRLLVEPPAGLSFEDVSSEKATISPQEPLAEGKLYRFTLLEEPDSPPARIWAFQVQRPLRVVQTLPRDQATDVPLDTGIELTFSHEGVIGVGSQFDIEPRVDGRFETHKRTVVFVPRQPLSPFTLYTVSVGAGVGLEGSDQTLGEDFTFRFETGSEKRGEEPAPFSSIQLSRAVSESPTGEPPVLSLYRASYGYPVEAPPVEPLSFTVYRFPDVDAFLDSLARFDAIPSWADQTRSRYRQDAAGLEEAVSFQATPESVGEYGDYFVSFPAPLPAGFYLVQASGATSSLQGWLQVTDVATYASIGLGKSLVWVNDVSAGGPIRGARVRGVGATLDVTTGDDGVAFFETPQDLVHLEPSQFGYSTASVVGNLVVEAPDGRSAVVPLGSIFTGFRYYGYRAYGYVGNPSFYWRFLYTDRHLYRLTDTIRFWGLVRARENPPSSQEVTVRITGSGSEYEYEPVVVAEDTFTTSASGTFAGELSFAGVSAGYYNLEVAVGDQVVTSTFLEVRDFVKPAYKIDVVPDRKAVFNGETVNFDVSATFFEGSPVPNLGLKYTSYSGLPEGQVTTDAAGRAVVSAKVPPVGAGYPYSNSMSLDVVPQMAEEGEITGSAWVQVFPAGVTFDDVKTDFREGQAVVEGQLRAVDLDRINSEQAKDTNDFLSDPLPGRRVDAQVEEVTYEQIQEGEYYDFIAKIVRPRYRYDERRRSLPNLQATTDTQGRFAFTFSGSQDVTYEVTLTAVDDAGRQAVLETGVYGRFRGYYSDQPYLSAGRKENYSGFGPTNTYALGEAVELTMRVGPDDLPSGGPNRYLFYFAQNGLRDYRVQDASHLSFSFGEEHIPSIDVVGVRFTGATYQEVGYGYTARLDPEERKLTVQVEPDRERYEPGDEATLNVTVTGPDGNGVRAEVLLSAVDEAIFRLEQPGYDYERNILEQLYEAVDPGILHTYASHQYPPVATGAERGGGGGPREDFKDVAFFGTVATGGDGRGSVSFKLPDNLTSWRVTALAVTNDPSPTLRAGLYAGNGLKLVPVGLPFFVDVVLNRDYLTSDKPMLRVRGFGQEVQAGDPVSFEVSAPSLGLTEPLTAEGVAFQPVDIALPALSEGTHDLIIKGSHGSLSDSLKRTIQVLPSRLVQTQASFTELMEGISLKGSPDRATRVVFSDHNRGRYLPVLQSLSWTYGDRVDQMLARALSQEMLAAYFDEKSFAPPAEFDSALYQTPDGGIALFPYADEDLTLSARVAAVAPDRFGQQSLAAYFRRVYEDQNETRERAIIALYGLAALGEPVLPAVQAAAAALDLDWRERLYVALAAQELGDEDTARGLERGLLEQFGERRGPAARLRVGVDQDDILEATSLAAILAAGLGDALAPDLFEYTLSNYTTDILVELEQISYLVNVLPRLSAQPVRFAYTLDGQRKEVELKGGESLALLLSADELAALNPAPLEGRVGVATFYLAPLDPAAIVRDTDVAISRVFQGPSGGPLVLREGELVRVVLDYTLGPQALDGCYQVSDLLPSGLKAVTRLYAWGITDPNAFYPYLIEGQRVSFCVYKSDLRPTIIYYARVTGRGEFEAEPAIIQSQKAPESINLSASEQVVIP